MKNSKPIVYAAFLAALALPMSAHAGAESGIYLGAGFGDTNIKGSLSGSNLEFDSTGYKILLGYNFGVIPLIDLAVEGAYVDMGEEKVGGVQFEQTSLNAIGVAGLSFGPFGLYGKAGLASWDAKSSAAGFSTTKSGVDPVYGMGIRLQLMSLTGRLEIEYYDQDQFDDVSMATFSLLYTF